MRACFASGTALASACWRHWLPAGCHACTRRRNRTTTLAHHYIEAFAEEKRRQAKKGQARTRGVPCHPSGPCLTSAHRSIWALCHCTFRAPLLERYSSQITSNSGVTQEVQLLHRECDEVWKK